MITINRRTRSLHRQSIRYAQAYQKDPVQWTAGLAHVLERENRISKGVTWLLRRIPVLLVLCPLHFPLFVVLPACLALCCIARRAWSHRKMDAILYFDSVCLHGQLDAGFRKRPLPPQ